MFGLIASLALAAAASTGHSAPGAKSAPDAKLAPVKTPPAKAVLGSSAKSAARTAPLKLAPWWEKITVTMDGDGKTESCKYESSGEAQSSDDCALFSASMSNSESQTPASSQFTKLTFERRFSPGAAIPTDVPLATGDTLLGREVMALAINGRGRVTGCTVVTTSGDLPPEYSCNDASAEHFALPGKGADPRQGFFTIRIYGHSEHVAMRDRHDRRA